MPSKPTTEAIRASVAAIYQRESRRVFATLIRLLGEFELAEEALHDAFAAAMEQWPRDGVPTNPRAWLVSTGRFKAIDAIRRRSRFDASLAELAQHFDKSPTAAPMEELNHVADDQLRLIFTCCHPSLSPESQVALTLREVCGLTTEEIASAFLTSPPTIAQRIVRGKAKIRDEQIPYQVPALSELPDRLGVVLSVVYLVFNEGYSASNGDSVTRGELSNEAIRLGRLLHELQPHPEVRGLLALMLLHESRRLTRSNAEGDVVLLEQQDRRRWDAQLIDEGLRLVAEQEQGTRWGSYSLQAAIAAEHARAVTASATNWRKIAELYGVLLQILPSPVIALNQAVAISMFAGPEAGLQRIAALLEQGELKSYHLAHAAQADLLRKTGQFTAALASYRRALDLARQLPERRFLQQRITELEKKSEIPVDFQEPRTTIP